MNRAGLLSALFATAFLTACAGATQPLRVDRAAQVKTNTSPAETAAILNAAHTGLIDQLMKSETAARGGLRRAVLQSVQVDGPMAMVTGCGSFYYFAVPESHAITLIAMKDANGWSLHSWQADTDGLHGPLQPCR